MNPVQMTREGFTSTFKAASNLPFAGAHHDFVVLMSRKHELAQQDWKNNKTIRQEYFKVNKEAKVARFLMEDKNKERIHEWLVDYSSILADDNGLLLRFSDRTESDGKRYHHASVHYAESEEWIGNVARTKEKYQCVVRAIQFLDEYEADPVNAMKFHMKRGDDDT